MIKLFKWIVDHVDSDIIVCSLASVFCVLLSFLFWFISEAIKHLGIGGITKVLGLAITAFILVVIALSVIFGVFFIIVAVLAYVEKLVIKLFNRIANYVSNFR